MTIREFGAVRYAALWCALIVGIVTVIGVVAAYVTDLQHDARLWREFAAEREQACAGLPSIEIVECLGPVF